MPTSTYLFWFFTQYIDYFGQKDYPGFKLIFWHEDDYFYDEKGVDVGMNDYVLFRL